MSMKEEYTAIDMSTAAADGFRDGQRAAQSAPAWEREEEAFEDQAKPLGFDLTVPRNGDYRDPETLTAWRWFQRGAAWQRTQSPWVPDAIPMRPFQTVDRGSTNYAAGWNACRKAMLSAAPAQPAAQGEFGDAYQGAREDLAIWKRRALEAEEKVRQQDSIIDHLTLEAQGETRMGEPFIAQGQQSPNYWRDLAIANRKVADEALAELTALKAQQVGQEPVAWLIDWPDEPELGGYFSEEPCETGRSRPLYTTPQPAPAQDVADVRKMARALSDRQADACNVDREDQWKLYSEDFVADVEAMLAAAHDKQSGGGV